ncbi:MAG: outer membrane protein assembly factor BamD [Bacteroidota bacterium]|nr:outer membrane protein assembly factor BamD [Bacteroidota bacterium]
MKKLALLLLFSFILFGCAGSLDTSNMSPEDRLAHAMKLYNDESYEDAIKEFEPLVMQFPGHAIVDQAQYYLGMSRFNRKEYILAAYEFSKLINNMAASKLLPDAQFMLGECYYQLSPDFSLDQKYTKKSIQEFQSFVDFFPNHERTKTAEAKISELNDKLAYKEYNSAYIYERLEYYNAALYYYNNVVETYHDSKYASLALFNRINILVMKSRNAEALKEIAKYMDRYPDTADYPKVAEIKKSLEKAG